MKPGESLEKGVQPAYLLSEHQAVLLRSIVSYVDTNDPAHPTGKARTPGETWMVFGPTLYIPTVEVEVLETRKSIALDEQEGFAFFPPSFFSFSTQRMTPSFSPVFTSATSAQGLCLW